LILQIESTILQDVTQEENNIIINYFR